MQGLRLGPGKVHHLLDKVVCLARLHELAIHADAHLRLPAAPRCRQLCRARAHLEDKWVEQPLDHLADRKGLWSHPARRQHVASAETQRQHAAARCEGKRCEVWSSEACWMTGDGRTAARGVGGTKGARVRQVLPASTEHNARNAAQAQQLIPRAPELWTCRTRRRRFF